MEKLFVPYEIAKQLKEKGFDKECLAIYTHNNEHYKAGTFFLHHPHPFTIEELTPIVQDIRDTTVYITAPLYQQVVDWFREEHNLNLEWSLYNKDSSYWIYIKDNYGLIKYQFLTVFDINEFYFMQQMIIQEALRLI